MGLVGKTIKTSLTIKENMNVELNKDTESFIDLMEKFIKGILIKTIYMEKVYIGEMMGSFIKGIL